MLDFTDPLYSEFPLLSELVIQFKGLSHILIWCCGSGSGSSFAVQDPVPGTSVAGLLLTAGGHTGMSIGYPSLMPAGF